MVFSRTRRSATGGLLDLEEIRRRIAYTVDAGSGGVCTRPSSRQGEVTVHGRSVTGQVQEQDETSNLLGLELAPGSPRT